MLIRFFFSLLCLSACSNTQLNGASHYDFDHKLQYKETKIDDDNYHLEIIRYDPVYFEQLATFLIRQSYIICNSYGFKIEVLGGVEGFNDKEGMPNYIQGNLIANIECRS